MTVIARRIVSDPVRLASETWTAIVDLLAPDENNSARVELLSVIGIASSLISSETMKDTPIVVYGSGPQVRIYCLHGEEALAGENANETQLVSTPINGDWKVSLPCPEPKLEWIQKSLRSKSSRITARDLSTTVEDITSDGGQTREKSTGVDRKAFFRL